MKKSNLDVGIKEEERDAADDEEKSNPSFAGPNFSGGHQATADQQHLWRIEKLLSRNSNLIKEPQLYSKDIEI